MYCLISLIILISGDQKNPSQIDLNSKTSLAVTCCYEITLKCFYMFIGFMFCLYSLLSLYCISAAVRKRYKALEQIVRIPGLRNLCYNSLVGRHEHIHLLDLDLIFHYETITVPPSGTLS